MTPRNYQQTKKDRQASEYVLILFLGQRPGGSFLHCRQMFSHADMAGTTQRTGT